MSSVVKDGSLVISPVLFLNVKGQPMRFYIRPGTTKVQLQPVITNGGGVLCRTPEPGAILLADPGEITAVMESAGQFYVSTQYIRDCIKESQQLEVDDYRINNVQHVQPRSTRRNRGGSGRMSYSQEDDAAILSFMVKRHHEARGNRVWKQMEKQAVTSHSWQSMKDRFLKHLHHKLPDKSKEKQLELTLKQVPPQSSSKKYVAQPPSGMDVPSPTKEQVNPTPDSDTPQATPEKKDAQLSLERIDQQPLPKKANSPQSAPAVDETPPDPPSDRTEEQPSTERPEEEASPEETYSQAQSEDAHTEISSKRSRLDAAAGEDIAQGASGQLMTPQVAEIEGGKTSTPIKRKLGILERAAREFEYSQETDDGSQEDLPLSNTSSVDPSESGNENPIFAAQEQAVQEQNGKTEPQPEGAQQKSLEAQCNGHAQRPEDNGPGPSRSVPTTSNAHMFLFDHESQEEELSQSSQEVILSQDLLEAEQHILDLMSESKQSLATVTKALLKTSGDITLALRYLLTGSHGGHLWNRHDDNLLLSGDPSELFKLHEKYGEEEVSKRIAFLDTE